MVYCAKCGTKNEEDAEYCSKCGANLTVSEKKSLEQRAEEWGERVGKRAEEECFGLPHGGAIAGLIFGIIIILVGASWFTGFEWEHFWPAVVILFGTLVIAGALYDISRR